LMDFHHNTSLKSILEKDSISSSSKAHIRSCLGKGVGIWLVDKPSICLFRIIHFSFILALRFRFGLIQPSPFNIPTCECGHGLDASSTHLACYSFGGQWITTHDIIRKVMYALARRMGMLNGERWYAFMLRISMQVDFYMTRKNQVFVANVEVIDLT
jgi:hypothetical protein